MTFQFIDIPELMRMDALYPDSDGKPMSDNTLQFQWISTLKGNLDILFANDPQVFVAGDLLWYPLLGQPKIRCAPDIMVAFGRPKGYRGSYRQWEEEGIAPQVVFEILSPSNTAKEMAEKLEFYQHFSVEEYIVIDPDAKSFMVWERHEKELVNVEPEHQTWASKRLGIQLRKDQEGDRLLVSYPDGKPFMDYVELNQYAENERKEKEALAAENERLKAKLRESGLSED